VGRARIVLAFVVRVASRAALFYAAASLVAGASTASSPLACASRRNPSLLGYTFEMNVAMRMRHFPWLRFHLAGTGSYSRGQDYFVTFTRMPMFAKDIHKIDLSPLDPSMWSKSYLVRFEGTRNGSMVFSLRPRTIDRTESDPLTGAVVFLDARYSTRYVILNYANGSIQLAVDQAPVDEYRLPISGDVNIDMPGNALFAHAQFFNYAITARTASAPAPADKRLQCEDPAWVAASVH
jgi:hypothetical protein